MTVVIGVDPHKGSHTAVAIDDDEQQLASIEVRSGPRSSSSCSAGRPSSRIGCGRSSRRAGSGICWRNSSSVPASGCWMCRRRWRRGCGCWRRAEVATRTTRNDALSIAIAASRAPRMHAGAAGRSRGRVAVVGETASGSGPGPEPHARVGCTRCCSSSFRAEFPRKSRVNAAQRAPRPDRAADPVAQIRHELASEHLDDLRHLDAQMRASKQRIEAAVAASGTTRDRHLRCRSGRRRDGHRPYSQRRPVRGP